MKSYGLAVLLLALGLVGFSPEARASVYVTGQVVLEPTQAPVSGATLSLYTANNTTPVDVCQSLYNGSFVLRAPSAGQYRLEASGTTCYTINQAIKVTNRGVSALHVGVRVRPVLMVQIVGQNLVPAPNQAMYLLMQTTTKAGNSLRYFPIRTSPQGVAQVTAPDDFPQAADVQSLSILVRAPGAGIGEVHLTHWPGKLIVIQIGRPGVLSGAVLDAAGKPLARVGVIATRILAPDALAVGHGRMDVSTNAAGQFKMALFAAGHYRIQVANLDPKLYPPVEVDLGSKAMQVKFAPVRK